MAIRLDGFEDFMTQTLREWNVPGAAVCVMSGDELVQHPVNSFM